jgi:transcriptional regulator of acetoin/glycerol metabolism
MELAKTIARHRKHVFSVISDEKAEMPVDAKICTSWQRCVNDHGLDPDSEHQPHFVDKQVLQECKERLSTLLNIARVEMANLYQQVAGSGHSILLTDEKGMIINYVGDPAFEEEAAKRGLTEGAVWTEEHQGTNSIGTCLAEQQPVNIHQDEHFFSNNLSLTCTAVPIFDPNHKVIAVLDASSKSTNAQQHTMALVKMSAKAIENRIFLSMFKKHFIMRFHSRPEFVNTLGEGLIAFQNDGTVLAATPSALFQLNFKSCEELRTHKIDKLFDSPLQTLLRHSVYGSLQAVPIHQSKHSKRFFAIVQIPESEAPGEHNSSTPEKRPRTERTAASAFSTQDPLEFGDPQMAQNIRVARRVLDRDIPILLHGESGTGKGVFAKAMHLASERGEKPFIAINCASIPESLIESELFGYKAGAFTGASRHGSPGKIMQANGGTLFLDEIGDMPLSLQARLLRVLEEKEVVPLGGHTPMSVELRVISATHRNLPEMVQQGSFREDLYYRLQGVKVTLPPLRERADRYNLIKHLIVIESRSDGRSLQVSEEVIELLCNYYWPGNIRQVRNVLRTMFALAETDRITADDLIEDLIHEARGSNDGETDQLLVEEEKPHDPLRNAERNALLQELERHRWNISNAAKSLMLSRNTLYRKMNCCNITRPR